jgi:hypothetical protein
MRLHVQNIIVLKDFQISYKNTLFVYGDLEKKYNYVQSKFAYLFQIKVSL